MEIPAGVFPILPAGVEAVPPNARGRAGQQRIDEIFRRRFGDERPAVERFGFQIRMSEFVEFEAGNRIRPNINLQQAGYGGQLYLRRVFSRPRHLPPLTMDDFINAIHAELFLAYRDLQIGPGSNLTQNSKMDVLFLMQHIVDGQQRQVAARDEERQQQDQPEQQQADDGHNNDEDDDERQAPRRRPRRTADREVAAQVDLILNHPRNRIAAARLNADREIAQQAFPDLPRAARRRRAPSPSERTVRRRRGAGVEQHGGARARLRRRLEDRQPAVAAYEPEPEPEPEPNPEPLPEPEPAEVDPDIQAAAQAAQAPQDEAFIRPLAQVYGVHNPGVLIQMIRRSLTENLGGSDQTEVTTNLQAVPYYFEVIAWPNSNPNRNAVRQQRSIPGAYVAEPNEINQAAPIRQRGFQFTQDRRMNADAMDIGIVPEDGDEDDNDDDDPPVPAGAVVTPAWLELFKRGANNAGRVFTATQMAKWTSKTHAELELSAAPLTNPMHCLMAAILFLHHEQLTPAMSALGRSVPAQELVQPSAINRFLDILGLAPRGWRVRDHSGVTLAEFVSGALALARASLCRCSSLQVRHTSRLSAFENGAVFGGEPLRRHHQDACRLGAGAAQVRESLACTRLQVCGGV